ncbi:MAG TPA: energy transducer TonB [Caulobacteraceae bacterium]|nr:energy transducer TonB [Caulobacteraceae bacterium]
MKCAATSSGSLSDCSVVEESPAGQGFGAAALSLAAGMALKPTDVNGKPVTGRNLIVPVKFEAAMLRNGGTLITNPDWLRRPTQDEMIRYFPADSAGVTGLARIVCVVTTRGLLDRCVIDQETPSGHGFGQAALAMSSIFVMRPMSVDGLPVGGGRITIPIRFEGDMGGAIRDTITVMRAAPWMTAPTAEQVAAAFPKGAVAKTPSAHVVLRCGFRDDGELKDCETVSSTSNDHAFPDAARSLAKSFRAYVDPKKDKLARLRVDVPFDFRDPSQSAPPNEVYDPLWLKTVNPAYLVQLFPPAAAKAGVRSGKAMLDCGVRQDGGLKDCTVESEEPAGLGFGGAALTVASVMVMNPWTAQGTPVDGAHIRLPVRLEFPADAAATQAPTQSAAPKP